MSSAGRFKQRFIALGALSLAACGGGRSESAAPSSAPPSPVVVEVPAPAAANEHGTASRSSSTRAEPRAADPEAEALEIERDGGTIHISSVGDAGVRVWGSFARSDGGFSFQGGFTVGQPPGDGGP